MDFETKLFLPTVMAYFVYETKSYESDRKDVVEGE